MDILDVWYALDKNERVMLDANNKRMVVSTIETVKIVKEQLPEFTVITKAQAVFPSMIKNWQFANS